MNTTLKQSITNFRVIILAAALIMAVIAINPQLDTNGAAIRGITKDSASLIAGIEPPKENSPPTSLEIILAINNIAVSSVDDYNTLTRNLTPNQTITIETDRGFYTLFVQPLINKTVIGQENRTVNETIEEQINETKVNRTQTITRTFNITKDDLLGAKDLGLRVAPVASTNLIKGLDLAGGARVLLQPETVLSVQDLDSLVDNLKLRLNVFGLSDVVIRSAEDLEGNQFVLVEIAGVSEEEVRNLIAKQGKFESKLTNHTVFRGGNDIVYVCRTADCSGIDPQYGCSSAQGGAQCRFRFQISLSPPAAQRQADLTSQVHLNDKGDYLAEPLILYLDDEEVDQLQIASDLRGRAVTDISISGSGTGASQELALEDALKNMKRLQTILITGSLPVKLNIVQTKSLSPQLGEEFLKNALTMGILSLLVVAGIIFIRYRKLMISIPVIITMLSEMILTLGFAALFKWNLDLAAIAGVIVSVGTGVNDQIIITDEVLEGQHRGEHVTNWKEKIKMAFGIVFTAWGLMMVAMIPLLFAGAGLLRGFALTTMAGITFGVLVTRPAFAKFIEIVLNK